MSAQRMTRRAGEARKTPPARALLPAAAAVVAAVVLAALTLTGCGEMDLLGLVRLRVTGASGIVIYVSKEGSDSNSGFSPDKPLNDIEEAMNTAERVGASEVRVAEGTYVIDTATENRIGMRPGVALKGGYSGDFATWDPENHESIIKTREIIHEFINASGPEVHDASIEGFTIDVAMSEPEGVEDLGLGVVTIHNGASVSVLNNRFLVHLSGSFDEEGVVIYQHTNEEDQPAQYNMTIHGNDILITSDTPGNRRVRAIQLGQQASGSSVVVSANRIAVLGDGVVDGIAISDCTNLSIWNNVISVVGQGDTNGMSVEGGGMTGVVSNNTIIASDVSTANAEALDFSGSGPISDVVVRMNIFGTPDGAGTGVVNEHDGTFDHSYNLCFGFGSAFGGNVTDLGSNQFELADIFAEVFSSSYDSDFSDGDSADYHLDDTGSGGPYAVDQGAAGFYGTDVDFEGDPRPQGAAVDRGADEKM